MSLPILHSTLAPDALLREVRACRICEDTLDPRPVLRLSPNSKVIIIGQAPGTKVHASGIPWDDASGDHLREWLNVDRETFDDVDLFGILPMGFCYPGKRKGGDAPPPKICAETWHARLLDLVNDPPLILLLGMHAQAHYLPNRKRTLTETVGAWAEYGPQCIPLPHPAWRSKLWMKRNPWFAAEVLPELRSRIEMLRG